VTALAAQVAELQKAVAEFKPTDLSTVTAEITAAKTELAKLTAAASAAAAAAKKSEIASLVAEASHDGKVIPLTDEQLSKMDVADIKEMITKLPKDQVQLNKKANLPPANKDGKPIRVGTVEHREFCQTKREEGLAQLNDMFRAQTTHN
jgi:hypothetical protein